MGKVYRFVLTYKTSFTGLIESELTLLVLDIIRETPKGYWINYQGVKKFIKKDSRVSFAYLDVQSAKINFIKRKEKMIKLYEQGIKAAKIGLQDIKEDNFKVYPEDFTLNK